MLTASFSGQGGSSWGNWSPHREQGQQVPPTWLSPTTHSHHMLLFQLPGNGCSKWFFHLCLSENKCQHGLEPTSSLFNVRAKQSRLHPSAKKLTKKCPERGVVLDFVLISVFCHETNDEKHMGTAKMNQGHLVSLTFQHEAE